MTVSLIPDPAAISAYSLVLSALGLVIKDSRTDDIALAMVRAVRATENAPAPDHTVSIGDAWTTQTDDPAKLGHKAAITSTLVANEFVDGRPTLKVHISFPVSVKGYPDSTIFVDGFYNIARDTWQIVKKDITISNVVFAKDAVNDGGVGTLVISEHVIPAKKEAAEVKK